MSDIFISYARATEPQATAIAEALRAAGYGVWRDDEIPAHRAYADVIKERLRAAKAVVVVWSADASASEWVRSEAERARTDRKLVQLTVDGADLPMPFDQIQCADLAGWSGDVAHPGWRQVAASVAALAGPTVGAGNKPARAQPRKLAICVLPFDNISGDPEQEYFSDGISEDIITDLSKVSALFVVARNTAFTLKGKPIEVQQVARQFNVSHVLEGSVRKAGNRVRITAQLIDGATGGHAWAERWDRNLDDIFALQDEISQAIVGALRLKLLPEEKLAIERRGTENAEAYDLYLMARRHFLGASSKRLDLVIRLCRGAIELDPKYARPWALMAFCASSQAVSRPELRATAEAATEQALALDPDLGEAHAAKGRLLIDDGRFEEARAVLATAQRLAPDSGEVNRTAGSCALGQRRFAEARDYFNAAAAVDEGDGVSLFMTIQCHEALGDDEGARAAAREAVTRLEKAVAAEPDNGSILAYGVGALLVLGEFDRAKDWARHALLLEPDDTNLRYNLACAISRSGDTAYALDLLEQCLAKGGKAILNWAETDNDLDRLRPLPRFEEIMASARERDATAQVA
ncbi:MAG TPA: TIR domain-containing protein [Caulobacteraceae bacterium]|nr:TIR domain-containing protein [Caulobacteraceae bacterium]